MFNDWCVCLVSELLVNTGGALDFLNSVLSSSLTSFQLQNTREDTLKSNLQI
jgi:hypothetical protein